MIVQIRGVLLDKNPGSVIVETGGIGYRLYISLSTFYELREVGETVLLHAHTHVREDALQLFGFSTPLERELFQILIGVSGIGPKLAMNILSGISPPELLRSLEERDVERLVSVPGIGQKTAERMLLDLQEKAKKIKSHWAIPDTEKPAPDGMAEDVISALVNLGYKKNLAEKAVQGTIQKNPGASLEQALKESLRVLAAL